MDTKNNILEKGKEESAAFKRTLRTLLHALKELTKSEEVTIWLRYSEKNRVKNFDLEMDRDEMKEYFDQRIAEIRKGNPGNEVIQNLTADATDKYSILKFVASTETMFFESDFSKRPEKYLVLDCVDSEFICNEGMSASCVRKGKPIICLSEEEVLAHPSHRALNRDYTQGQEAKQTVIIPIKDNEFTNGYVIGCIKVENFSRELKTLNIKTAEILNGEIPLFCTVLKRSQADDKDLSYDTLFQGIKFLDTLKLIKKQVKESELSTGGIQNRKVYDKLLHLFYVLKRKAYVGYDPIMERITGFCSDISKELKINFDIVKNLLESFKKHEDLFLYSHNEYRDHFLHQFHVFCCGYVILNYIGFEKIIHLLNKRHRLQKSLTIFNILRIWFFTSFFHDFSYILPKLDKNISNFLRDILFFDFGVNFDWSQLFGPGCKFEQSLQEIVKCFDIDAEYKTDTVNLLAKLNVAMINLRDHGVLSSILFYQKMKEEGYVPGETSDQSCIDLETYYFELGISALSIAIHNESVYRKITDNPTEQRISFSNFPIACLLAFCDIFADWGRKRHLREGRWEKSTFVSIKCRDTEYGRRQITCSLNYEPSKNEYKCIPKETIQDWYDHSEGPNKSFKLSSEELKFEQKFYTRELNDIDDTNYTWPVSW